MLHPITEQVLAHPKCLIEVNILIQQIIQHNACILILNQNRIQPQQLINHFNTQFLRSILHHLPNQTECILTTRLFDKHRIRLHVGKEVVLHFGIFVAVHELSDLVVVLAVFLAPLEDYLDLGWC